MIERHCKGYVKHAVPTNSNSELSEEEIEDIKQSHNNWLGNYAKEKMNQRRNQVMRQRAKGIMDNLV